MALKIGNSITLLFFIFPVVALSLGKGNNGFRVELSHVDSKSNFSQIELLNRAAARTTHRWSRLMGMQLFSSANISSTVMYDEGEYLMDLAIGTPPLYYSAILDTGSDLIWTPCTPCKRSCASQPTSLYDPSKSSTVSSIPCNNIFYWYLCISAFGYLPPGACACSYNYTYGTGWTSGTLKRETFTFGTSNPVPVSGLVFGCSTSSSADVFSGTSGLVGFSRGPFSLPSQHNISMFSYCLGSFMDVHSKSSLLIGPWANFSGTVKSTPFVKSPFREPFPHYYITLLGISLGATNLGIQPSTFSLQSNGSGGIIIDSGTSTTLLVNKAYQAVQNAIDSIITLRRVNASDAPQDLCYNLPSGNSWPTMPDMTFHFEGADMVLPKENYMMSISYNDSDSLLCLAMSGSDSMSVFGNYQQQNFHILYDLSKDALSFAPARCDSL